jgi:pimeloyl-ACP methyl ester carboxylesterase
LRECLDDSRKVRVIADRETAAIDLAEMGVDILEVRKRFSAGLENVSTEELKDLAGRFRGEFMEGLELRGLSEFHLWCLAEREQARTLQVRLLRELLRRLDDKPDEAIPYARLLLRIADDDEKAKATLSRLLMASRSAGRHEPRIALVQEIRFCSAYDGVRIAYSTAGSGKSLVKAANWLNHLEFDWQSPVWRHLVEGLSVSHRLVRYDQRGNGLSDWQVGQISFDAFVRDLETVVDAAGLERFALLGISQGCAVSIAFAVQHPERVTCLILHGGYARGALKRSPEEAEQRRALEVLMKHSWGRDNVAFRQVFTSLFVPDATEEHIRWFNELQLRSTAPEIAVRFMRTTGAIDVTSLLPKVRVPVLVLHSRNDRVVPFEEGRLLATAIPGARFVPLESRNHLILEQEPAWSRFLTEVLQFVDAV